MKFTTKKILLYILAMVLLGTAVTLIQSTLMGMSAWDALHRNFYEGIPLQYKYVNAASAVLFVGLAYIIEWKKPKWIMFFPILISFFIGAIIDLELTFVPDVSNGAIYINIIYLAIATLSIAVALNIIIYSGFPLPAIDQLCTAMAKRFHLTFGQGKFLGEVLAALGAVVAGELFGFRGEIYYLGFTTIYFILFLGFIIDFVRYPMFRLLGAISKVEMYADDMLKEDINKKNVRKTSRAIIVKDGKILLQFVKGHDLFMLPGGGKEKFETLQHCLKREVLEETGYLIKKLEEKTIVMEYFPDATYENHFYLVKLKSDKIYKNRIKQTEEEIKAKLEHEWVDIKEAITILDEHDSTHEHGNHIQNREFLGIINSL
ncbi:MAG: NUDIX domain-containing protein [Tenericutes bacterium]|nr:NUDIX domain-containing protein [Mycoplasmatota bacterium]